MLNEKHEFANHSGSDTDKAMAGKYDVDVTPAGEQTVHDAVFGELDEGGPDYRGVSRLGDSSAQCESEGRGLSSADFALTTT